MGEFWVSTGSFYYWLLFLWLLFWQEKWNFTSWRETQSGNNLGCCLGDTDEKRRRKNTRIHKASGVSYRQWWICNLPNLCPSREDQNTFRMAGVNGVGWPEQPKTPNSRRNGKQRVEMTEHSLRIFFWRETNQVQSLVEFKGQTELETEKRIIHMRLGVPWIQVNRILFLQGFLHPPSLY